MSRSYPPRAKGSLEPADTSLVLGLVAPTGVNVEQVIGALRTRFERYNYRVEYVRLSELLLRLYPNEDVPEKPDDLRIPKLMDLGNRLREEMKDSGALASAAIQEIRRRRKKHANDADPDGIKGSGRTVYVLRSLKHPSEVRVLRDVYRHGFFLVGVSASRSAREQYLREERGIEATAVKDLIKRDHEEEGKPHGQRTGKTFHLSDAFIHLPEIGGEPTEQGPISFDKQSWRLVDLLFGDPFHTPTKDEYAMFLAYAASLRSADLSRQVGAVVASEAGEIIATGANDVPCFGGGLYWPDRDPFPSNPGERVDQRDWVRKSDANKDVRDEILTEVLGAVGRESDGEARKKLLGTSLADITEYGRAVHAEMEALLACARIGADPRGGTLFSTTFPCHNCTKHVVAAGIRRVVYVEPYPKSRAERLHGDAIEVSAISHQVSQKTRVSFQPFVGLGPRRFFDLFSLRLGDGRPVKRASPDGKIEVFEPSSDRDLRIPLDNQSYLDREKVAMEPLEKFRGGGTSGI